MHVGVRAFPSASVIIIILYIFWVYSYAYSYLRNSLFEKDLIDRSGHCCHAEVLLTKPRLAEKQIKATDNCQK